MKSWRNTKDGPGGHFSTFDSEAELDKKIETCVTLYMYITGMCYDELKSKYDI